MKEAGKVEPGFLLGVFERTYTHADCALHHRNPFELLVATILSAQCTDERVNQVTPWLFKRYPDPPTMAAATQEELEALVRPTGFFRNKAKSIQAASTMIIDRFSGKVPDTMEGLIQLPGVARKTANVLLGTAFGKNEGVVVDTHVGRLAIRLGLTRETDPVKVEKDLMELFPKPKWTFLGHSLILHGRSICSARKPDCGACPLAVHCPKVGVTI